jgi:hypothetical protein
MAASFSKAWKRPWWKCLFQLRVGEEVRVAVAESLRDYFPDRWTWLFVLGIAFLSYGTAAFMCSRYNHEYNRHVHPVFHPWAILVGCGLVWYSVRNSP